MGLKGVSPLIATVLLIAAVIAIAGIISIWLTSFTRTTTSSVETTATNQTKCAGAYLKIDSVSSTLIYYSNPSSQTITNIILVYSNGTTMTGVSSLAPGIAASMNLTRGGNTEITVKGLCLSSVPVEGKCTSSDSCWS